MLENPRKNCSSFSNSWNSDRTRVKIIYSENFERNFLLYINWLRSENDFNVKQVRYLPGIEWAIVNIQVEFIRRLRVRGQYTHCMY